MIKVSIATLIFIFVGIPLLLMLFLWIRFERSHRGIFKNKVFKEKLFVCCPYCRFSFVEMKNTKVTRCPQCQNWIKREEIV